jgi:hypothetical protein
MSVQTSKKAKLFDNEEKMFSFATKEKTRNIYESLRTELEDDINANVWKDTIECEGTPDWATMAENDILKKNIEVELHKEAVRPKITRIQETAETKEQNKTNNTRGNTTDNVTQITTNNMTTITSEQTNQILDNRKGKQTSVQNNGGIDDTDTNEKLIQNSANEIPITSKEEKKTRQWSDLFPKLRGGRAIFTSSTPRQKIHSKNDNALVIDIQKLDNIPTNDIIAALAASIGGDLLAAKTHIAKGKRSLLEIILKDKDKVQKYAAEGISLFKQTLFGYIPINLKRSFLTIKLKNTPMGNKETVGKQIQEAFRDIGQISAIKPLFYEGTSVCSDQWLVTFETTEDPQLSSRIPRSTHVGDHRVFTDWKEAPKTCYYCEREGHLKRDCEELKASITARQLLKEAKSLKENSSYRSTASPEISFDANNPYINKDTENNQEAAEEASMDIESAAAYKKTKITTELFQNDKEDQLMTTSEETSIASVTSENDTEHSENNIFQNTHDTEQGSQGLEIPTDTDSYISQEKAQEEPFTLVTSKKQKNKNAKKKKETNTYYSGQQKAIRGARPGTPYSRN